MDGVKESCFGTVDGLVAFKNNKSTDEHLKNVMTALYWLSSGERAAYVDAATCLNGVCKTSRDAIGQFEATDKDPGNKECADRLIAEVTAPPTGVTADQSAAAAQMMDEVIVPQMQALLAGETSAQDMYDAIVSAAKDAFGEDGCELD